MLVAIFRRHLINTITNSPLASPGLVAEHIGRTLWSAIPTNYLHGYMDGTNTEKTRTREIQSAFDFVMQYLQSPKDVALHIGRALHTTVSREHAKGYEDGYDAAQLYELTLHSPEG